MQFKNHAFCAIFHERVIKHHRRKNTCNAQMKPLSLQSFSVLVIHFFLSSPYAVSAVKPGRAQKSIGIVSVGIWGIWLEAQTFLNCGNSYLVFKENKKRAWGTGPAQTTHPAVALNCCSPSLWLPQQHLAKIWWQTKSSHWGCGSEKSGFHWRALQPSFSPLLHLPTR